MTSEYVHFSVVFAVSLVLMSLFFVHRHPTKVSMLGFPGCWSNAAPNTGYRALRQAVKCSLQSTTSDDNSSCSCRNRRVVAVGDVHGNFVALLETLLQAELVATDSTTGAAICQWSNQLLSGKRHGQGGEELLLIQVGDIVDRGPEAPEAWQCLKHLQETAPHAGIEVKRLLGNHDLMWLEGRFQNRNKKFDTQTRVMGLIVQMKAEILNGTVVGAVASTLSTGAEVLFVHAGVRPAFLEYVKSTGKLATASSANATTSTSASAAATATPASTSAAEMANWINQQTVQDIKECTRSGQNVPCKLVSPLYGAGRDRGGSEIGGVYWTDFRVLQGIGAESQFAQFPPLPWVQVVGHTADPGNIRIARGLSAVCIDGGMQYGGRTYLEITPAGRFIAHEKAVNGNWHHRDLSALACE